MRKIFIDKEALECAMQSNKTKLEIAKHFNIDIATLKRLCVDNDILWNRPSIQKGRERPKSHPEINAEWLISNWVSTDKSLPELSAEFNISASLLEARRDKYGIKKPFKYLINRDKLFNIADPNVWYLMGLIATDGYIESENDAIDLELSGDSELKLLEDIKKYFNSLAPITAHDHNPGNRSHRIRLSCGGLHQFLRDNFNLHTKAKSFDVKVPDIKASIECKAAYIRGALDGDGSISIGCDGLYICLLSASYDFCVGLQQYIKQVTGVTLSIHPQESYFVLNGCCNKAKKLCEAIYNNEGLRLDRKYQKYKSYIDS